MYKNFSLIGSYNYIDHLKKFLTFYNNRKHSKIKMAPVDVTSENEKFLLDTVYREKNQIVKKPKFKLGSFVRVSKYKNIFEKKYTPNWSTEIFRIIKIDLKYPELYYIQDYLGENVLGAFYRWELTSVHDPSSYLVEKILKRKGSKAFVKFLGFDSTHNQWVDADTII